MHGCHRINQSPSRGKTRAEERQRLEELREHEMDRRFARMQQGQSFTGLSSRRIRDPNLPDRVIDTLTKRIQRMKMPESRPPQQPNFDDDGGDHPLSSPNQDNDVGVKSKYSKIWLVIACILLLGTSFLLLVRYTNHQFFYISFCYEAVSPT